MKEKAMTRDKFDVRRFNPDAYRRIVIVPKLFAKMCSLKTIIYLRPCFSIVFASIY